jgi:hypothetical protein
MKRIIAFGVMLFLPLFAGCLMNSDFVRTGKVYDALPDNAEVQVYEHQKPWKFEEIGIVTIRGGELLMRIDEAKKIARSHGGNGVLIGSASIKNTRSSGRSSEYGAGISSDGSFMSYDNASSGATNEWVEQTFVIIRILEEKAPQ